MGRRDGLTAQITRGPPQSQKQRTLCVCDVRGLIMILQMCASMFSRGLLMILQICVCAGAYVCASVQCISVCVCVYMYMYMYMCVNIYKYI